MHKSKWLEPSELFRIVSIISSLGIEEVRLTGGEPTLRNDLCEIASALSALNIKKLALTTNGFLLGRHLKGLADTRCKNINVSLDSLDQETFSRIAMRDGFQETMDSILKSIEMGFNVKLNMVVMKGINDHEIPHFVTFAEKTGTEVRFLELMKIGHASSTQSSLFVSAQTIEDIISQSSIITPEPSEPDATASLYRTNKGGRIGIIAPVTRSFCATCSRWRLSPDGHLKACLMNEGGVSLRGLSEQDIVQECIKALELKPFKGRRETSEMMHAIGG